MCVCVSSDAAASAAVVCACVCVYVCLVILLPGPLVFLSASCLWRAYIAVSMTWLLTCLTGNIISSINRLPFVTWPTTTCSVDWLKGGHMAFTIMEWWTNDVQQLKVKVRSMKCRTFFVWHFVDMYQWYISCHRLGEEMYGIWGGGLPTKRTWKVVVQKDCQARNLNKEDAMDCDRWKKLIKIGEWSGWWVGECFLWYRLTR